MSQLDETTLLHICRPNTDDLDFLAELIATEGVPCTTDFLTYHLLKRRTGAATDKFAQLAEQLPPGTVIYQIAGDYEVGQQIYHARFQQMAIVEGKRRDKHATCDDKGQTVWHDCAVIKLSGFPREFICAAPFFKPEMPPGLSAEDLIENLGSECREALKRAMRGDHRFVTYDRQWLLRDLLLTEQDGLSSEAIEAFLHEYGKPATVDEIAGGIFDDASDPVALFSLGWHLETRTDLYYQTDRTRPMRWYAHSCLPETAKPSRVAVPSVRSRIKEKPPSLKRQPPKEHRPRQPPRRRQSVTFPIPIGFRESGAIPLNSQTLGVFPQGTDEQPITFEDARSGDQIRGKVCYKENPPYAGNIYDWLEGYGIPAGGLVKLERTDDEYVLKLDYIPAMTRKSYPVRVVHFVDGELIAENRHITPPCEIDATQYAYSTIFEDYEAMLAEATDSIFDLICLIFDALSQDEPDGAVHYKAIASAVSYLRRCAPSTVWSLLSQHECFKPAEQAGYWIFNRDAVLGMDETEDVQDSILRPVMALDNELPELRNRIAALLEKAKAQARHIQFGS